MSNNSIQNNFDRDNGLIFNIQKFSIHDGHGIRTLIFMKGCPLKCAWCSNPESQSFKEDLLFVRTKCIGCGKCFDACQSSCTDSETFDIDRNKCIMCGACADACQAFSKKVVGRWTKRSDIIEEADKDRLFYRNSGGGITIGGGEPTAQPKFVSALFKDLKMLNLHTAIETCGYCSWENLSSVLEYVDQIFMDLKHMDPVKHKEYTGVDNTLILENAKKVSELNKDVIFRIPLIPGYNDDEENIVATAKFVSRLGDNVKIEVLPYHGLGEDKFKWMDQKYQLSGLSNSPKEVKYQTNEIIKRYDCLVVE